MFRDFILPGIVIGIGSAISPGPLLLLIVSETLRGGLRSGWVMAIAPLITDIPFIIASMLLAKGIGLFQPLIGVLSLVGGAFLVFLAYQNIVVTQEKLQQPPKAPLSLLKAIITNLLNPYMYIFWFSVALPIFARGNLMGSALFASALLLSVVGSLMAVGVIVAIVRTRFLNYLHWIIRALSICLFLVALMFVREGILLLS